MREHRELAGRIIGPAIDVHRQSEPGLWESIDAVFPRLEREQAAAPVCHLVMAWRVRATDRGRCYTGGPDKPRHDDEGVA